MATTAEYLNKLVSQKNTLADNLVTKGVTATHDETLETLVPKVLEISSSGYKTSYADGIVKRYNDFGNDKWVQIEQDSNDTFVMSNENTIECCFVYYETNSSGIGRIFESKNNSGSLKYQTNIADGHFDLAINGNWYDGGSQIEVYTLNVNELYTITAIFKSDGTDIYINGSLFVTIPEIISANDNIATILLKKSFSTSNRTIAGRIYDMRMYNRALSDSEIINNWQADVERYGASGE